MARSPGPAVPSLPRTRKTSPCSISSSRVEADLPPKLSYPGGARFAFTILDDTDDATEANVAPVYALLQDLGLRTTKTVWPVACEEGSPLFHAGHTLDDPGYRAFVERLAAQ